MANKIFLILCSLLFSISYGNATETCSRIATINFQEVLVDPNSSQKGEGLRYFLEKDPESKNYLDLYQKGTEINWQNALLGTLGTGLILSSTMVNDSQNKKVLLISGATFVLLNFLISRTLEVQNELNLEKAIEEYNKRNLPKIDFNPQALQFEENNEKDNSHSNFNPFDISFGIFKTWTF